MKPIKAGLVGRPANAGHLCVKTVVARGRVSGVDLEFFGNGIDLVAESRYQGRISDRSGQNATRKQHDSGPRGDFHRFTLWAMSRRPPGRQMSSMTCRTPTSRSPTA